MADERINLIPPFWGGGNIPELLRLVTPVLRAFDFRKSMAAESPILSDNLTSSFGSSNIRLTIALRKPDHVIATIYNDIAEDLYLNGGEKLSDRALYSFDIPLVSGHGINFKLAHDNFIEMFAIYEQGVTP
jgi:hypothetical protein